MIRFVLDCIFQRVITTAAQRWAEDCRYRSECSNAFTGLAIIDAPEPEPDLFLLAFEDEMEEVEPVELQPAPALREASPLLVHPYYLHRPEVQFA